MSRQTSIREFDASDFEGVRQVLRETWAQCYAGLGLLESMYKLLEDEALTFLLPKAGEMPLLALVDAEPAGVLVTRRVRSIDFILALYIRPRFQRTGLGKALLAHPSCNGTKPPPQEAWVREASPGAIAFYRALGFAEVGRRCVALAPDPTAKVIVMQRRQTLLTSAP
ncbi:GNAT family N-acetyltransferase [Pyxidicoccus xibeiensis]|uniref:GNAT family N-acetyltransferase n=1 Tax=Pyxidicoccus xibeiensis TaxID=2906759 RepID=UPI0020A81111|nr:GNAT family N-acetyltransferase [Pyxidicoccus xibeiensis]MCP3137832.1 GNAT family N-acetyltransferase [Pyxidicoccus xibeiensis]